MGYFVTQEDIFQHGQFFHQRQFLVNNGDTFAFGIADVTRLNLFSRKNNFAFVGTMGINTTQHFHQR
ncbi:Uncharacterised protein [Klebsiella pneumoniae]|nr:Uncharacterised protein [Klebsiella pneumoniae]